MAIILLSFITKIIFLFFSAFKEKCSLRVRVLDKKVVFALEKFKKFELYGARQDTVSLFCCCKFNLKSCLNQRTLSII